jgi:hypothetical protein
MIYLHFYLDYLFFYSSYMETTTTLLLFLKLGGRQR